MEWIVEQTLAKDKKERYPTVRQVGADLEDPTRSQPQGKRTLVKRGRTPLVLLVGMVAVAVVLMCAGLAIAFFPDDPTPSPTETLHPTNTPTPTLSPSPTETLHPTNTPTPTLSPTPKFGIGSTQVSPVDGMVTVYVPAGEFLMGSEDGYSDESPVHSVYLDTYWIDQHEVTNAMFAEFLDTRGNQEEGGATWLDAYDEDVLIEQSGGDWQPVSGYGDHPVIEVTWYGAQAYCQWVERRLPTEAEWEKAARGEDGLIYPWGDVFNCSKGNFDDETIITDYVIFGGEVCDGFDRTAPVGSFKPGASPYGALDMAGNVVELVADWYREDYYDQSPSENPLGPDSGEYRVLRGSSWVAYFDFDFFRAAHRGGSSPDDSLNGSGFRCARSP